MTVDLGIRGKRVVFTGAAGLIGSAACEALAAEGADIALVDIAKDRVEALAQKLAKSYPKGRFLPLFDVDTLATKSVDAMLAAFEEEVGPVDILINCAYPRTSDWHKRFEDIDFASWQQNVDSHLNGYFLMTQRTALRMIPRKQGVIVNFSSIYGLVGPDFKIYDGLGAMTMPAAYSVIKGAVSNFTRYLAAYLGPHGIRVNALCPGGVEADQAATFVEAYKRRTPLGRMATPEDVIGSLLYLVSDLSSYVTGVNLAVDGGWTAI